MGLLSRLFGKKPKEEDKVKYPVKMEIENGVIEISKDGTVEGYFMQKIQGVDYKIKIDTTVEEMEDERKRKQDKFSRKQQAVSDDETIITIEDFINKYRVNIPEKLFTDLLNESSKGYNQSVIKRNVLKKIEASKIKQDKVNNNLARTAELNNKGIAYEKQGDIDNAILVYEENIKLGNLSTHSYDRLMILYRKRKDKENEKRVINRAINVFTKKDKRKMHTSIIEKWEGRLEKLNQ